MKHFLILFLFCWQTVVVFCQAPTINILRANDNFNFVKKDTLKKGFNHLKYISIGKNNFISFGGELREQYQYFDNSNFGDAPPTFKEISVGQVWHRVMVHSNLEIGTKLRIFAQLNSTFRFLNPNPLTLEIDENRLSLHQAFLDYYFNKNWMLRVGRQEIGYGNNRIITFREGPNTRLAFDAAIIKYTNPKRKIDLLAITPVVSKQFAFDDQSFKEYVLGIYATENIIPKKILLDYYALNFSSKKRKYNFASGNENRQSLGVRIFSKNLKFNYELETTYQMGTFNTQKINAYALSSDINYKTKTKINLTFGLGANYISGDKNKMDNKLNTYNLIFSKPSYGLAAPIGSSNIVNLNPYIKLNPLPKLSVYAGVYFMQRLSIVDGTYSPGMAQVRPAPVNLFTSTQKAIGTQYALESNYDLNKNISFALDGAFFKAGSYIKETGKGLNITYISFKGAFKF